MVCQRILTHPWGVAAIVTADRTQQRNRRGGPKEQLTVLVMSGHSNAENPYMQLLVGAFRDRDVDIRTPINPFFFPLTRAVYVNPDADVLQLDWLYEFYTTSDIGIDVIDAVISILRAAMFCVDLFLVSRFGPAVVKHVHNKHHHEQSLPRTERIVNELTFALADRLVVKCDRAAEVLATTYVTFNADDAVVVSDGSFISAYENEVSTAAARSELGIDEDTFVYLFFGLIRPYKGVTDLLRAFSAADLPNSELWIVGNPTEDSLELELRRLTDEVSGVQTVFEFIPEERIQYYMNAADVLVLPYRSILNSGSAHLGLSFGLPIVAPAIGCLPETVTADGGTLYDPDDPDGLKDALGAVRADPSLPAIGRSNLERARENTWDSTADRLVSLYSSVSSTGDSNRDS